MGRLDELVSAEFARWEQRGRGWQVWPEPVRPEPPFEEFAGYRIKQTSGELVDDGRKPGLLASFFDSLERKLTPPPSIEHEEPVDPEPVVSEEPLTVEFVASLPAKLELRDEVFRALLDSLQGCAEPTAFELLASKGNITVQFAASASDAPALQRQLTAFLPKLSFAQTKDNLTGAWQRSDGDAFIVEFGLAHEVMLLLETSQAVDPFVGLVAVLNELRPDEVAVFQVLFQGVRHPWPGSVWRSVTDANGKALFVNRPQLITGTKAKLESPLFGVVVRAAVKAENFERSVVVLRDMASTLRTFSRHEGNRLIPLSNEDYDFEAHEADLTSRQSRRGGMLLNRDELLGFVHLPADEVQASRLRRQRFQTKAAPAHALSPSGLLMGHNHHAGRMTPVGLTADQRTQHLHVIGAPGSGKSTFLFNLIKQDIEAGQGLAVLDPHGDLIKRILGAIPPERIGDVVLVDPSDESAFIGFNILSAHSDLEKRLLASDLVSVFARLSTSWGDQMEGVFRNAILAFLESSQGGTLWDLRRFLLDPKFREKFLATVQDRDIQYFWRKGFAHLGGNKSIGPVLTRLEMFLAPKPIRYMVSQPVNRLDFADILDSGKILLARLSHGAIGRENAYLLGSLFVAKLQQTVMARQEQEEAARRDFWLYCDEFHNFITPSMAEILTDVRKYRLGLVLAHQYLRQLERDSDVASAVLSSPYTRVVFRVGDDDARKLESGFTSFAARDLQSLGKGEAIVRVGGSSGDFNLAVSMPEEIDPAVAKARRMEVTETSRRTYATPRSELEAAEHLQYQTEEPEPPQPAVVRKVAETPPVPKPTEVPKVEVPPATEPPKPLATEPVTAPGKISQDSLETEHTAIKRHITHHAEALGYHVAAEEFVADTLGRADLVLRRGKRVVACEVSVTTNAEDELGNLTKCLSGGYSQVVLVATSPRKLANIERRFRKTARAEDLAKVVFSLPADLVEQLRKWAASDPRDLAAEKSFPPKQSINLGSSKMTQAERTERERVHLASLEQALKPPPTA